ncbi:monovalent cation/H(+) antiporter subunit G [Neorhizobium sp. T786]|uniref:monovalent cation/H(+) antiporter subunit G n=1 Tax=Pseudorhizobium xiangyangii TaxID=2883104 RepID=UPI001D000E9B|nr:monovalent cation/H(+) antiporter subunit G [Neorhizobium xiangyangii]MCB5202768.1 monovalent cation/H(+) antiporter subunit G [Neorhizobium xiangyangii]
MMDLVLALATALLILVGTVFTFAAAIGINRFPDLYTRMHAASKAGTVGSALMLVAVGVHAADLAILARSFAGFFFFVLTAPVSAHLLAKAAHDSGYPLSDISVLDEKKTDEPRI